MTTPLRSKRHARRVRAARPSAVEVPILPVCSSCSRVRDGADAPWETQEAYVRRGGRVEVRLSHGFCEECFESAYQDFNEAPPTS